MKLVDKIKLDMLLYGLSHDYLGYATIVESKAKGVYVITINGEKFKYNRKELIIEWDNLNSKDKIMISSGYCKDVLKIK